MVFIFDTDSRKISELQTAFFLIRKCIHRAPKAQAQANFYFPAILRSCRRLNSWCAPPSVPKHALQAERFSRLWPKHPEPHIKPPATDQLAAPGRAQSGPDAWGYWTSPGTRYFSALLLTLFAPQARVQTTT